MMHGIFRWMIFLENGSQYINIWAVCYCSHNSVNNVRIIPSYLPFILAHLSRRVKWTFLIGSWFSWKMFRLWCYLCATCLNYINNSLNALQERSIRTSVCRWNKPGGRNQLVDCLVSAWCVYHRVLRYVEGNQKFRKGISKTLLNI